MTVLVLVAFGVLMFAFGLYDGWVLWGDDRGEWYTPESTSERSGWIHEGRLYMFEREITVDKEA